MMSFLLRVWVYFCLILLCCLPSYLSYAKPSKKIETKVVEVEKVSLGNITQTVRLIGTVKAKHSTTFIAKSQGILRHQVRAGHRVSKGTIIATLDNAELERTYALSLDAVKIAKIQYERLLPLIETHVISKQTLEEKRAQWIEAQKKLSLAKIELDKSRFIAPFEGIVGIYKITSGSQVQEGETIVTIYDPSDIVVEFDIPGTLLHQLKDGQRVTINGKHFSINHIQQIIDPDTQMSNASVHFKCKDCFIGETIDVDLSVLEHRNVIVVPSDAVFLKNGRMFAYTVVDNKAKLKPVLIGIREKNKVEIIEGLTEGDALILRGQTRLYPNIAVKIHHDTQIAKAS